jgi:predicted AAA+ superfamily ATPase
MIERPFWLQRIDRAWRQAPIVWLTGVRRAGKTVLAQAFPDAEFLNCDLPSNAERLADPERFFRSLTKPLLVLDEVHQLPDPSRLLKIAADAFPNLKVLATGSSTLAATSKFRDSLAGRKRVVELTPVLAEELSAFGVADIQVRLHRGGLPQALLAETPDPEFYGEWLDSYYARDVQELFHLGKRAEFLRMVELVLRQSGGMLEFTTLAKHTGVSRATVASWMDILQITHVAYLMRPFAEGGRREILAQPKVYGFDTGFVRYARGWEDLHPEDCGVLWEHLVLDTLRAAQCPKIHFWRDKQQREVDFVLPRGRNGVDAVECRWNPDALDPRGIKAFRENYPEGRNYLLSPGIQHRSVRQVGGIEVLAVPISEVRDELGRQLGFSRPG